MIVLCLYFGQASEARAGSFGGAYYYDYQTTVADPGCGSPADGTRNIFASIAGANSISSTDTVTFSICHGATGILDGGEFTIGSGPNTASGIFSGVYAGVSTDPGTLPDGNPLDGGSLFDGIFEITAADGYYAGELDDTGSVEINTGTGAEQVNGYFTFTTPEPVSMLLAGSGLVLMGLLKNMRKSTHP